MQYRPYGKLGYEVSLLGMGCMRLPRRMLEDGSAEVDREKAFEMIRYAAENGVNYFDTAFSYHRETSESVLGEALAGGLRSKVRIATKQPFYEMRTQGDIRRNLENTLKKLRTDYIDVYLIHCIQANTWEAIKERKVLAEYEKFKAEGLIGAIAFSYHGKYPGFKQVLDEYDWDMCQIQQNILDRDNEATEQGIIDAGKKGCALVIMEPLRGGGLAGAPREVRAVYDQGEPGRSPAEWAFRYLYDYPQVSTILSGMSTLEQIKDNIRIFSKADVRPGVVTPKEREIIDRARTAYQSRTGIPCTACEYCMPCPNGVSIPGVFARYNDGTMFEDFDNAQRSYMFLTAGGRDASHCVECGVCEGKCPQHIGIIKELKVAHEALEGWKE